MDDEMKLIDRKCFNGDEAEAVNKYAILKYIFNEINFRYDDGALSFLNNLKKDRNYSDLDIINAWCKCVIDNTLQNIARLDCVKIVIE